MICAPAKNPEVDAFWPVFLQIEIYRYAKAGNLKVPPTDQPSDGGRC